MRQSKSCLNLSGFSILLDEIDYILDRHDFFSGIVGNFHAEFFFKSHDKLNRIQAVCAKIVDKACGVRNFVCCDIKLVNDKGIQAVLKEVDNDELGLALKTASEQLKTKIFSNMSERAAQLIKEDMEYMGPVRVSDVESAQQRIVDIVRRLEDAGEIILAGRGAESELIV